MKAYVEDKNKEISFPCLMAGKNYGGVYLVIRRDGPNAIGTVVVKPNSPLWDLGRYYTNLVWESLVPFNGRVILEGE